MIVTDSHEARERMLLREMDLSEPSRLDCYRALLAGERVTFWDWMAALWTGRHPLPAPPVPKAEA